MPYYHVHVDWKDEFGATRWSENTDFSRVQINELVTTMKKKIPFILKKLRVNPSTITEMEIWKTEERAHGKSNIWQWIRHHGENVTNDFIITLPTRSEKEETETGPSRETKEIRLSKSQCANS